MTYALKEWAIVVDALIRGEQIIVLRKGGISEGPGGFKVDQPEFLLFPTLFHQQPLISGHQVHLAGIIQNSRAIRAGNNFVARLCAQNNVLGQPHVATTANAVINTNDAHPAFRAF